MAIHKANQQQQETWIPLEQAKDCSQGFCSIYCPQWCYVIFPPPPPFSFIDEDTDSSSNTTAFSPLVIAIIGILASAFLLTSYYTIVSKYCGGFNRTRNHDQDDHLHEHNGDEDDDEMRHHESTTWHVPPSNGLDRALIDKISVYKYRKNDGVVEGTDCSVCLGEFGEEESLRLLPKCSHAFHLQCIDTWLSSHSNCPLCRANIVPPPPPVVEEDVGSEDVAIVVEGLEEREGSSGSGGDELHEEMKEDNCNDDDVVIEIKEEECSDDCVCRERVSIGDVLKMDMEEEYAMFSGRCSTSKSRGENSKGGCGKGKGLHCVLSSTRMKRSMSGGRIGFSRQGRGRSSVLPV